MATKQANPPANGTVAPIEVSAGGVEPTLKTQLKKKEFFERVVDRSGVRKGEAKTAIEAALAVLGEALANGEELNLPPLGKIKVARQKSTPRGMAYNLRLVRNDAEIGSVAPPEAD